MVPLTLPARVALMKRTPNCSGFGSEMTRFAPGLRKKQVSPPS